VLEATAPEDELLEAHNLPPELEDVLVELELEELLEEVASSAA
jgi:hypothetical protein